MRHSQGSVGAPHGLKDCRASDAKSTNVRTADVDRRLVCEHVRKPLYGPRPLIFDRTTSTVEANSLRHPQGDPATATDFGRKLPANSPHGGRMCDVTRALRQNDSQTCFKQLLPAVQMKGARTANRVLYTGLGNATTVYA